MKVIQYLINSLLPEDLRDYNRSYDKKSMNEMLSKVAEKYPEKYKDIVDNLVRITGDAVYNMGETVTLNDFKPVFDRDKLFNQMDNEIDSVNKNISNRKNRENAKKEIHERYADMFEKATMDSLSGGTNNLYKSVKSGARGNNFQLKAILSTPALYTDYKQNTIPLFIRHSYSDGLSTPEYLAGTFGTRYANMTIKKGTAKHGGLGKELNRVAAESVITSNKDYSNNGLDLDVDDDSLYGRVLARDVPAAGLKAGTLMDRDAINTLHRFKIKKVIVHSPIATTSAYGIPAEAYGMDYNKKLPPIGFHAGLTATTGLAEPFIQGSLCLEENTLVKMSDGSNKKIKDIEIGDKVLSSDINGKLGVANVLNKFYQGKKDVNRYYLKNGNKVLYVDCTRDHKFLMERLHSRFIAPIGNLIKRCVCSQDGLLFTKFKIQNLGKLNCYDIEIDSPDHLFVLSNNIITSNSSKHSGGGFEGKKKTFSGFKYLNQFFQSPLQYQDKAPIAFESGIVKKIYPAEQGGTYIVIGSKEYYVDPNTEIYVKEGQEVERGQQLSDGLLDPEEVTMVSGIGEGRRVFSELTKQILDDSGAKANKRNTETVARSYIDKVQITDPNGYGGFFAGDIVSYNTLEANYKPNENSKLISVKNKKDLVDKYLQRPVLNYTIGTRLTPSMIDRIEKSEITDSLLVSDDDVPFKPVYFRLREGSTKGSDSFLEKANASYQKSNYVESAIRGNETNIRQNVNPFVRITFPDFAKNISSTGKF